MIASEPVLPYATAGRDVGGVRFAGNALAGVEIRRGGKPVLRRCKVHDGKHVGVAIYEQGQGKLEECEIYGNHLSGLEIRKVANPLVRKCKLHDGKQAGVLVLDQGEGILEGCEVFANMRSGVEIRAGGKPTLRSTKIYGGRECGVLVCDHGAGILEKCEITGNALAGLEISQGGKPLVRGGRFIAENPAVSACTRTEKARWKSATSLGMLFLAWKSGKAAIPCCDDVASTMAAKLVSW